MKIEVNRDKTSRPVKAFVSDAGSLVIPLRGEERPVFLTGLGRCFVGTGKWTNLTNCPDYTPLYEGDSVTITF